MHHSFLQLLFWLYYLMVCAAAWLLLREIVRGESWKTQTLAGLALLPLILRVLLLK